MKTLDLYRNNILSDLPIPQKGNIHILPIKSVFRKSWFELHLFLKIIGVKNKK
jgi:hypothetical protein